nr:hypothetical protein [Desulfovibrio sp.]
LRVEVLPREELWARTRDCSCVARKDFDAYYAGCGQGVAIFFGRFQVMNPLPVELVARRPPQRWIVKRQLKDTIGDNLKIQLSRPFRGTCPWL